MEDLVVDLGMRFQLLLAFLKDNLPRSSVPVHIELLLAFALWTLSLVGISVGYRVIASMTGAERADAWRRGQPPNPRDPGFVVRAGEAHQNCLETLPVLTAVVFASHALARSSVIAPLAQFFFVLRVAQSAAHVAGVNDAFVRLRAVFFLPQVAILVSWAIALLSDSDK